jgi:CBS domain-containing protein
MRVKDVMHQPFVTEKDISLKEVAKIMSSKKIGSLVYLSNGKVKGIVTKGDLVKNYDTDKKVSQVMATEVVTISPEETLKFAAEMMRKKKIKKLPVMSNRELVGIVTASDLIDNAEEIEDNFFFDY